MNQFIKFAGMGESLLETTSCIYNVMKVITVLTWAQFCLSQRLSSGPALVLESIWQPFSHWQVVGSGWSFWTFLISVLSFTSHPFPVSDDNFRCLCRMGNQQTYQLALMKAHKIQAFTVVKNKMYKIQMPRKINSFVTCLGRHKLYAALHLKTQVSFKVCSISFNDIKKAQCTFWDLSSMPGISLNIYSCSFLAYFRRSFTAGLK